MAADVDLEIQEEILLLALEDRKGTLIGSMVEYALAGAVLAEMLLRREVELTPSRKGKPLVRPAGHGRGRTGSEVLDEALEKIRGAKRAASPQTWVGRLARMKKLKHRVARGLCRRGILRIDERKLLLVFDRTVYPELDHGPEGEVVERLRRAIFEEEGTVAPETAVTVGLASCVDLLGPIFGKKPIRARKKRIQEILEQHPVS
ncbi:MAG TPA: GPP34 family phosphoprotein, partial [Longimicrobiales bacterium]|nr:GPP34 family phosphoprotein [Longimicrobiales bacterium]